MNHTKTWYVYMLRCSSGALYTGITIDPEARIKKHNKGEGARAVRALGLPVELVYLKKMDNHGAALKEEARIKKLPKKVKEQLTSDRRTI